MSTHNEHASTHNASEHIQPTNGHKRAVIYCRVSTDEQSKGYSCRLNWKRAARTLPNAGTPWPLNSLTITPEQVWTAPG